MTGTAEMARQRRVRWVTAAAAWAALATMAAALVVAIPQEVDGQAALRDYLERAGLGLLLGWMLFVLSGLAWLCLTVGLRRLLPSSGGRDLFVAAAASGQAAGWVGASLGTAAAPPEAHGVPLAVFNAFGEAAHLAFAAGTAAVGLGLLGLASALRSAPTVAPRWFGWLTAGAGVVLVPTAVAGPVSVPVTWGWLLLVGVVVLRTPAVAGPTGSVMAEARVS